MEQETKSRKIQLDWPKSKDLFCNTCYGGQIYESYRGMIRLVYVKCEQYSILTQYNLKVVTRARNNLLLIS